MAFYYDVEEVVEQGRAASYEATKAFRRMKQRGVEAGTLEAVHRELKIALARAEHLSDRHALTDHK